MLISRHRWFPLAAPSDYLYFLPPRRGVDSAKKLRLISSAAKPEIRSQFVRERGHSRRRQTITRLFFGNHPFSTVSSPDGLRNQEFGARGSSRSAGRIDAVDCDHYRALPLSDGAHMLFIDPDTHQLCMGSDAPLGGPTKLLRKFVCTVPPAPPDQSPHSVVPGCYAAGAELQWGVRIVAAYGSRIVLFSVAADLMDQMKTLTLTESAGIVDDSDLIRNIYLHSLERPATTATNSDAFSSVKVEGMEIGQMDGVVDFAVDSGNGGLKIWAFSSAGEAVVWTLDTVVPSATVVGRTKVRSDGNVELMPPVDADRDVVMGEAGESAQAGAEEGRTKSVLRVSFDGTSSFDDLPSPAQDTLMNLTEVNLDDATDVFVRNAHVVHEVPEASNYSPVFWTAETERQRVEKLCERSWASDFGISRCWVAQEDPRECGEWEIDYLGIGLGTGTALRSEDSRDLSDATGRLECEIL